MKNPILTFFTLIISILLLVQSSMASDKDKEKRWADQIVDSLVNGEAVWLNDGKDKFLALFNESEGKKDLGGVIIVHGMGVHPDWADIIAPMRNELPLFGWHTLSIQMPILPNEAVFKDYVPLFKEVPSRMNAAVNFLKDKKVSKIVVVAHSLGTDMTAVWLADTANAQEAVSGFVAIGMSAAKDDPKEANTLAALEKIKIPLLDIYGAQDMDGIIKSAPLKQAAARKAGNQDYRQDEVPGANHFFNGLQDDLVRRVRSWMAKRFDPATKK